jgi:hemoglobin
LIKDAHGSTVEAGVITWRGETTTVGEVETMYERVGGQAFFDGLIDRFYLEVAGDPVLRPLYPTDLTDSKAHLALFLGQYWGGPSTYSEQRGHPRLRMRHAPFVIGTLERDAWLRHMRAAIAASQLAPADEAELLAYFEMAASSLVNT